MRKLVLAALISATAAVAAGGCGKEIGDACILSTDCSPNGDRQCDTSSREGYCTIGGCDFDTCPDEAVCVRFFTGNFDTACDPTREDVSEDNCSLDELCSLRGVCVSRSSEIRYCMRKCDGAKDCREGYECRDIARMKMNGGEPVLSPGVPIDGSSPKFCATAPASR